MMRKTAVLIAAGLAIAVTGGAVALTATTGKRPPNAAALTATSTITASPTTTSAIPTPPVPPSSPTSQPPASGGAVATTSAASATTIPPGAPPGSVPGGIEAGRDAPTTAPQPGRPVPVTISYAGWDPGSRQVRVNAFVSLVESGGTCTLTVANGTDQRIATGTASADASTTVCAQLTISSATMTPGTWTATVTYTSPAYRGQSAPTNVVIP